MFKGGIFISTTDVKLPNWIKDLAIKYAKMHVKEAVQKIINKSRMTGKWWKDDWSDTELSVMDQDGNWIYINIDEEAILTAYPLENIK
jgi:hypothetical protein